MGTDSFRDSTAVLIKDHNQPVPICRPEHPRFVNSAERIVWQALRDQLADDVAVLANVRVTDRLKDHEADLVVALPNAGIAVIEVKGGSVWHTPDGWMQHRGGKDVPIDPVRQAREARYALRAYVECDTRWHGNGRRRVQWAHLIVVPNSDLGPDFDSPDCRRWMIADRGDVPMLGDIVRRLLVEQENRARRLTTRDVADLIEILGGRGRDQRDVVAVADERDTEAQRLTEEQAVILDAVRLLRRVEVRGGAGSGKTWLAVEQARRLARDGERVALLCYSRGLAAYLRRHVATFPPNERPAYVGEFHSLGHSWGAAMGSEKDSDYWENRLPAQMVDLADALPVDERFDSILVDEAQDFADSWWPAVLAALKDEQAGGLYVFSDEGQRVFARFGQPPVLLVPLMLDHNLRNTRQIADTFNPLAPIRMRLFGGDGPSVRFIECSTDEAMDAGDDAVDALVDEGWRPQDIALLTTGSRHTEQRARQELLGQDAYWETFWDVDQVFYGHVLGFKGLERRAVVLVLNESTIGERSRERLYVGLSRARDQLVVCGSREVLRHLGGEDVLREIAGDDPSV